MDSVLKTKDDVLQALQDTWNEKLECLFHRIQMHQHITADMFHEFVKSVKQSAITVAEKYKDTKEPITVVGFIDECTSTSVMGMMKEVLVDKSLDGELLPPNIMWIGAFNRNSVNAKGKGCHRGLHAHERQRPQQP